MDPARTRQLPPPVLDELLKQAKALGFATDRLIWVGQDRQEARMTHYFLWAEW